MLNTHSEETLKQIMKLNEIKLRGDTKMPMMGTKFPDKHEYRKERFFAVSPESDRYVELNFKYLKTFDSKTHPNTESFICQWTVTEPVFLIPNFFGGSESYASALLENGYRIFTTFDSAPYLDFARQHDGDIVPKLTKGTEEEAEAADEHGTFEALGCEIDKGIKFASAKIDEAIESANNITKSPLWKIIKVSIKGNK